MFSWVVFLAMTASANAETASTPPIPDMRQIPEGIHAPFYRLNEKQQVRVEPFWLDTVPVTNAQFLDFVRTESRWRRSRITALFAEKSYLSDWRSDLELGDSAHPDQPVTFVSWFAASAYCRSRGKRLPTESEWEWAARTDESLGEPEAEITARILSFYSSPRHPLPDVGHFPPNRFGVQDLHGVIWEWVEDFNAGFSTADSRQRGDRELQRFCGGSSTDVKDTKDYSSYIRYALRGSLGADYTLHHLGFRCARSIP
jgi:formylglycine-generating enzyme required for sulfatase activity